MSAETADQLRIYINPGHGAYTSNDRPMKTLRDVNGVMTEINPNAMKASSTNSDDGLNDGHTPDTTAFYESNTNLQKGFGLLDRLAEMGLKFDRTLNQTADNAWDVGAARDLSNNIVMSRVKSGPYPYKAGENKKYDRILSEVSEEVQANNFDMFISIHSNANVDGDNVNYPLFLYAGYDTPASEQIVSLDKQNTSRAMAKVVWPYAYSDSHALWSSSSATSMNIRGDISFYGSYGTNSATGESASLQVLRHNVPGFLVEGYFHTYQPARHRAMNWDVCRLEGYRYARGIAEYFGISKEKTGEIYGIVRDLHEKFSQTLYSPKAKTNDCYLPLNGVTVKLLKGGAVVDSTVTDNNYNGAFVFDGLEPGTYTLELSHADYKAADADQPTTVTVKAAETTYPSIFLESVSYEPPKIVYENYPNITAKGQYAADEYTFAQTYVDEEVAELSGKTVRRMIARDEKLYILAHDSEGTPYIYVYDAANKAIVATVSTTGTSGYVNAVADIQVTADGVLVACNESYNQYSDSQVDSGMTRGTHYIYKWENDANGLPTGDPVVLGSSQLSGNFYRARVGHTMAYSGTLEDGQIVVPAHNAATGNVKIFYNIYSISDGKIAQASTNNKDNGTNLSQSVLGDNYMFTTSPLDNDKFIATSALQTPGEFKFTDVVNSVDKMKAGIADGSNSAAFFRYSDRAYMVTAENSDNNTIGFKLTDITNGLSNATSVGTVNTTIPANGLGVIAAAAIGVRDLNDSITSAYLNLYAVRDGKITKLTTNGANLPKVRKEYAYGLKQAYDNETRTYTITYSLTGDAKGARLVLKPTTDADTVSYTLSDVTAGEHTYTLSANDLSENVTYNWAVEVDNPTIAQSGLYSSETIEFSNRRAGLAVFTNPEYDAFGYKGLAIAGNQGIDIYNPAGEKVGTRVQKSCEAIGGTGANTSSPMRAATRGNEMLMASWGNASYGVTAMDITNPEAGVYSVFEGTKADSGLVTNNGVNVGSGTPGVGFYDDGENSVMYTFDEDLASNKMVRYDIGTARTWGQAPSKIYDNTKSLLANTNVGFIATANGVFASQVRGAGSNAKGCPGFAYIDKEGNILFQSSSIDGMNSSTSAIALSADGKTMAVGEIGQVGIYDLSWNDNTPVFTLRYKFDVAATGVQGTMYFDYANNLHYYMRTNSTYFVYSLGAPADSVSTPAKSSYTILGVGNTGVEDVAAETEGDAIYYNLQGIRVSAERLTPGIYVKIQGKKSTKVYVK